jgi:chorismate dehydratase
MSAPLRVGRIVALNMYPIYHHLERLHDARFTFTDGLPAELNRGVLEGTLDVSAMSSIEYARNAERLELLPVASISAAGAVDSIQVFSRVPFAQLRTIAVTPHSATSVGLLRVLVGPDVRFEPLAEPVASAVRRVDGVLLIADEALHGLRDGVAPYHTDLGERWRSLTGLPMVFAVWAARREASTALRACLSTLTRALMTANERFAADPEPIVRAAAERFPFPAEYIRDYFARLSYGFGKAERSGLNKFLELAHDAGELEHVPPLAA